MALLPTIETIVRIHSFCCLLWNAIKNELTLHLITFSPFLYTCISLFPELYPNLYFSIRLFSSVSLSIALFFLLFLCYLWSVY